MELLQKVPVFQFLGVQELGLVASRLGLTTYEAGKVIFEKDSSGTALQIIAAGSVKIYIPSESGEEAPLAVLKTGDYFGELALLDGGSRTASAMALNRTATLTLERDNFLTFITTYPAGAAAVFRALAAWIRRQNSQLFGEFFQGSPQHPIHPPRLATLLLLALPQDPGYLVPMANPGAASPGTVPTPTGLPLRAGLPRRRTWCCRW